MTENSCETFWAKIYIAGPIEFAKQIIRRECMQDGLCVTVEPTSYVYTGGEESGYVVGFVNYPRFPTEPEDIIKRAKDLMVKLLEETYQNSAMLVTTTKTEWVSKKEIND